MRTATSSPRSSKLGRVASGTLLALVRYLATTERATAAAHRPAEPAPRPAASETSLVGEALLLRLETSIRHWEVEYRRFIHGERSRPPVEIGAAIDAILEDAYALTLGWGEVFRLESLEARFATSDRRFRRLLAARERTADTSHLVAHSL